MDFLTLTTSVIQTSTLDWYKVLAVFGTLGAIIFGYLAWKSKYGDSEKSTGSQSGQLISDVGYLKSGIDRILTKQDKQDENYTGIVCELGKQGESIKSAHHRIDTIEENIRSQGQYNGKGLE